MSNLVTYIKNISAGPLMFGTSTVNSGVKSYIFLKSEFFSSNAGYLIEQYSRGNIEIYDNTDTLIESAFPIINHTIDLYNFIQNSGFIPPIPPIYTNSSIALSGYESYISANTTSEQLQITLPQLCVLNKCVQQIDIKNQIGSNAITVTTSGTDNISRNNNVHIKSGKSLCVMPSVNWIDTSDTTSSSKVVTITDNINELEWIIDSLYTTTISVPDIKVGDNSIISVSLTPEFMTAITNSGRILVTNSWCPVDGSLVVFAKII